MKKNSRHLRLGTKLPGAYLRAPLVAALVGTAVLVAGCAAGPAAMGPAHAQAVRAPVGRETVRVRARVRGEGDDVVVIGAVRGFGSPGDGSHADIAVYAADGRLILTASAPYVATGEDTASFEKRLPGLRGRQIRLRLAHHTAKLPSGSGSCPNNAALEK